MPDVQKDLLDNTLKDTADLIEPQTISQMLATQRENAVKDKTDAAKMQKYYALTDALGALGKMGGVAVGGAIGGNMLDSAPMVADYQPSKGYVTAFEEAKKANERLRALDEKDYQLALRDEERSYNQQQKKLDRDWQKKMTDYQNQLARANAAEQNSIKRKMAAEERVFQEKILGIKNQAELDKERIKNQYKINETERARETMRLNRDLYAVPLAFNDGTGMMIPQNYYDKMTSFFTGKTIGGKTITKENVEQFLMDNPQAVKGYMNRFPEFALASTQATSGSVPTATQSKSSATPNSSKPSTLGTQMYSGLGAFTQYSADTPDNFVETTENVGRGNVNAVKDEFKSFKL